MPGWIGRPPRSSSPTSSRRGPPASVAGSGRAPMSIRGGGRPRDGARPMKPGAYEGADMPTWRATDGRGGPGPGHPLRDPRRQRGLPGPLKFVLFAGILAVVVVVAALTALRPVVRAAVVGWAWDNPSSFNLPFVAEFIREDLGEGPRRARRHRSRRRRLRGPAGRDADDPRAASPRRRLRPVRAGLPLHRDPGEARRRPPGRPVHPPPRHDPGRGRDRPRRGPRRRHLGRRHLPGEPPPRADDGPAPDGRLGRRPAGLLRPRQPPDTRSSSPTTRGSRRPAGPTAPRSRASSTRPPTP